MKLSSVKLNHTEFSQYGNHLQLKVSSPILRKWDTSSFPRAVLMPLAQFLFGSRSAELSSFSTFVHFSRAVKSLARTHMFSPRFPSQALVAKTLDQASAQFAASALVTTDQLLALKSKEELVLASGVNGVLAGAGEGHLCYYFTN